MATHKFFDKPQFHDASFYEGREVSDHIHEAAHRGRILRALHDVLYLLALDEESQSVCDLGCGNGGMLWELKKRGVEHCFGYDLSPKAIEWATKKYEVAAKLGDFTSEVDSSADIIVLTEVLEHLVDPPALLRKLKEKGARWVVATSPLYETPDNHYEFHLWAWDSAGFKQMFREAGYYILFHYAAVGGACQHVIALNQQALTKPLPIAP